MPGTEVSHGDPAGIERRQQALFVEVLLWEFDLRFRVGSQGHIINFQICEHYNGCSHLRLQNVVRGKTSQEEMAPNQWLSPACRTHCSSSCCFCIPWPSAEPLSSRPASPCAEWGLFRAFLLCKGGDSVLWRRLLLLMVGTMQLGSILNWMLSNYQINDNLEAFEACFSKQSELIYHCRTTTFQERKKSLPFLLFTLYMKCGIKWCLYKEYFPDLKISLLLFKSYFSM